MLLVFLRHDARHDFQKSIDHLRIELCVTAGFDFRERFRPGQGFTVRSVGRHGGKAIGNRQKPSENRNVFARESVGIAFAVEAFVMVTNAAQHFGQVRHVFHDQRAENRMLLQNAELVVVQASGLAQNRVGNRDFADVVQQAADANCALLFNGIIEFARHQKRPVRHVFRMAARVVIFVVDGRDQSIEYSKRATDAHFFKLTQLAIFC